MFRKILIGTTLAFLTVAGSASAGTLNPSASGRAQALEVVALAKVFAQAVDVYCAIAFLWDPRCTVLDDARLKTAAHVAILEKAKANPAATCEAYRAINTEMQYLVATIASAGYTGVEQIYADSLTLHAKLITALEQNCV